VSKRCLCGVDQSHDTADASVAFFADMDVARELRWA
jgi:hypothetical protein